MRRLARYQLVLASVVCAACQNLSAEPDVPAVLDNPTDAGRTELETVLREALGEREILLAPDALTSSSVLTLEPSVRGRLGEPSPLGRNLGRPETFQLVISEGSCYLIRPGTEERWPLLENRCVPEESDP